MIGRGWRGGAGAVARAALLLLVVSGAMAATAAPARAWWNDDWSLRKKITIDTSASGANITEPVGTQAVLVRLHAGNFRFGQAKDDGGDLRFVAGDDKTPLKYHVEKFDSLLAEALVWVQLPDLKPGAKTELWLYYGNKKATAAGDAKGSYDADTLLVYHFAERGTPPQDSSVWANGAPSAGVAAEGSIIGTGLRLDGQHPLTLPVSSSLALAAGGAFSFAAWIKPGALQPNAVLYSRRDGGNGLVIGLDNGAPFVEVTSAGNTQRSNPGLPVAPGGWHHVAVTASAGLLTLYLDGAATATLNATLPAFTGAAVIGGDAAAGAGAAAGPAAAPAAPSASIASSSTASSDAQPSQPAGDGTAPATDAAAAPAPVAAVGFAGDIDELELAKAARPAGFIKAQAIGQGPDPSKFIGFGQDEETASWFNGYFAIILKSVTLDGWVVIGVLVVMAVISWMVMVEKAAFVRGQLRANAAFLTQFARIAADLTLLEEGVDDAASLLGDHGREAERKLLQNAALYRIYQVGAAEIRQRFAATHQARVLSAASIAAIRAALDGALARESQRLNRLIVLLTIAISGGPFLGLLGTVVGVMITFAAIAASGDVNVNAIAPGIAAALVATVAGLGVAIPALFGYNYLISRIKDLSTDMQVFVDAFTTRMAEAYDGSAADAVPPLAAE
jgi:biopolymer transport protein ExbB